MAGIKMKATSKGPYTEVKAILSHPMETGRRINQQTGKVYPAHYIKEVTAEVNGRLVFSADWGPAIAKNPFLGFRFKGGNKGDPFKISWIDTKGASDSKEVKIR